MDLSQLYTADAHNSGSEMQVKGPTGEVTDFYITLAGIDSDVWRESVKSRRAAAVEAAMSGEGVEVDEAEVLALATIGWRGLESGGEGVEFSVDAAKELYRNAPYILDQVNVFVGDRANFTLDSFGE